MAPRKTTKTQSRPKKAAPAERLTVSVSPNGESTTSASVANGASPTFEQIQRRAYELFEARGSSHGCDWSDWFTAEQELTS